MLGTLDHLAIVVTDTGEALKVWRDRFGFPVLFSEVVNDGTVMLTHLDLGSVHLQLVEPLVEGNPLEGWLKKNGPGLHHLCIKVDDVELTSKVMRRVGLAVAVNDAETETKSVAHYVTESPGGKGAVREVCKLILRAQGKWEMLVEDYLEA